MIEKIFSLTLDTKRGVMESPVVVVAGDNGNVFNLRIQDGGNDLEIDGATAVVNFRGAAGSYTQDTETGGVTVSGATVSFPLDKRAVSEGTNSCDVQIYTGGLETPALITTAAFTFECRAATVGEEQIERDPSLPILIDLLRRMEAVAAEFPTISVEEIPGGHRITVANYEQETVSCDVMDGVSGVYVGSGDMPDRYNIQIDPEGGAADGFIPEPDDEGTDGQLLKTDGAGGRFWASESVSSVNGRTGAVTGLVNTAGIGEVTPLNLQIMDAELSPNLIDEDAITNGKYIQKNGTEHDGNYKVTDYIPVEAGEKYCFTWLEGGSRKSASLRFFACYDSGKVVVPSAGSDTMISEYPITIADGVSYVRLSFSNHATAYTKYQFEKGETPTEYHEYGEVIGAVIKPEYIPETSMSSIPAFALKEGQNLWNKSDPDLGVGKFLNTNGRLDDNASYITSGFISVSEGDRLIASYLGGDGTTPSAQMRTVAAFDYAKTAINAKGVYSVDDYTVPSGVSFVRVCLSKNSYGENIQIQKVDPGESFMPYKAYEEPHYELKPENAEAYPGKPENVYLPADVYVAVGRTIELYNEQIVLDHEKYRFRWVCPIGSAFARKFSVTGETAGNKKLVLNLYDDKGNLCWAGRSTIHVVAAGSPAKKILPIGDSLTNWKAWLQETMLLSGQSIEWLGTRYSGLSTDSEGNTYPSGTIHHEGRSGWSAADYLANTQYTFDNRYDGSDQVDGKANPFWDGTKFSLAHYLETQTGVAEPDAVQIFLGTNDLANKGAAGAAADIVSLIDAIRDEYADMPILLCNTIFRSNQNGYGSVGEEAYSGGSGANAWQYDEDAKVMDLMCALRESLKGYSGITFVPLASIMDREYDFGQVLTNVNPRSSVQIPMPAESVHPQAAGYYQMADEMYSAICANL